ncbi:unnamed protein product [Polarella glacialis]|uniref:Protein kinase domain-containing protein n=1 Tax=Polarella glacialis TaxID=89957 RepID=A0A813IBC3_POLGL|nr:unnamed protein product [Polarella glacialis]
MGHGGPVSWSEWLAEKLARSPGAVVGALSEELRFPTADGLVVVREESQLQHFQGSVSRARCTTSGIEFDLRRLRVGAEEGGLVTLEAFEAVDREADLVVRAGSHSNVVRCHGVLVQNVGGTHSRLLLCDACSEDLAAHLANRPGGELSAGEVADLGQQLAFGLAHLHSLGILCGSLAPAGVLRGTRDGLWKLADLRRAAVLPVAASEWRERCMAKPQARGRGRSDDALKPEADVWLLGSTLSAVLFGGGSSSSSGTGSSGSSAIDGVPAVPPHRLTDPGSARLWLLLHWLLAEDPESRPCAGESAALLGAVVHTPPQELLEEMPRRQRQRCRNAAMAAARQLAVDLAVSAPAVPGSPTGRRHSSRAWQLAELPLKSLREELDDPSLVDLLCANCGLDPEAGAEDGLEGEGGLEGSAAADAAAVTAAGEIARAAAVKQDQRSSDLSTNASSSSEDSSGGGGGGGIRGGSAFEEGNPFDIYGSTSSLSQEAERRKPEISADLLGLFD